ncbi:hypothetical protein [Streptomyces collinus]|uniref:hypothetical protein n=1 Tax=Streptomyces collinus TaxID=42684 RepID=UPI003683557C
MRAVLEPDITDYLRDQRADAPHLEGTAVALDAPRAEHLAQARQAVRAYTAAAHAGREQEAQRLLDFFPIPARVLATSGPARTWRQHSATARDAVTALAAQRTAITAEDSTDYVAAPELLHARAAYLTAREGQLHRLHDALGCLAFPTPAPLDLPETLAPVATAQTQRRVIEAFGTPERAAQALDGQIHYQLKQPLPARRRAGTAAETGLADLRPRRTAAPRGRGRAPRGGADPCPPAAGHGTPRRPRMPRPGGTDRPRRGPCASPRRRLHHPESAPVTRATASLRVPYGKCLFLTRLGAWIASRSPVPSSPSQSCCTGRPSCATACARACLPHP